MRFGGTLRWSRHGEAVKHDILLIQKECDEQRHRDGLRWLFEPQMSYTRMTLAFTTELLDGLLDVLRNKGVLTEAEQKAVRDAAEQRALARVREFFRVDNLDDIRS
jgi:hypothetical protein